MPSGLQSCNLALLAIQQIHPRQEDGCKQDNVMQNGVELQKALIKDVPAKIDIGPVYTVDPRRRKAYAGNVSVYLTPCTVKSR